MKKVVVLCSRGIFLGFLRAIEMLGFYDIYKAFGVNQALCGVSFEVRAGEIFGLLGPNGAGKTSLIRILMDVIRADAGSVSLFGELRTRAHLDRVTYLPEEAGLHRRRRVIDVMAYLGQLKGLGGVEARARARAWLDRIELAETAHWRVDRLSKGMAQKVQFAAALLPEPDLCVLDEPFAGLDPVNVRWAGETLAERRAAGRSTILSSHEMNKLETLCDRVGMIYRGRLVVYGSVEEVCRKYSRPTVEIQATSVPARVAGVEEVIELGKAKWRLRLAAGVEPGRVLADLLRAGADVHRFEPIVASLEDVFLSVVEGEGPG